MGSCLSCLTSSNSASASASGAGSADAQNGGGLMGASAKPAGDPVESMIQLQPGTCKFAGTVTRPQLGSKLATRSSAGVIKQNAEQGYSLSLTMADQQQWILNVALGPDPGKLGECSFQVSIEEKGTITFSGVGNGHVVEMDQLRIIEDFQFDLKSPVDQLKAVTVQGSLSWKLVPANAA